MAKVRLDTLMYKKGLTSSREKARALILAGEVRVNGLMVDKPGTALEEEVDVQIVSSRSRYVSRGGFKLEKAIFDFGIDFSNRIILDIGASTGGYTDCALQNGARRVYAVDVGYGQLDWSLRNDSRVVNLERTNIRYLTRESLKDDIDIITMDVSFISVTKIFPVIKNFIKPDGWIISLIKPQFEAGKNKVGKKGVVRDKVVHQEVLTNCIHEAQKVGLECCAVTYSPIKGPRGNIEYFICLQKGNTPESWDDVEDLIFKIVDKAHNELGG